MPGEENILEIPIDSSALGPALDILGRIDQKLTKIAKNSEYFSKMGKGINVANKELKKTDNLLGSIFKKLKLRD